MKKVTQQHTRNNFQTVDTKIKLPTNQIVKQTLKRDLPRTTFSPSPQLIEKIKIFMNSNSNYYLGFGGLGDALLLLAVCWNDPKAKVVYFANQTVFVKQFFDLFGMSVFLEKNIMGSKLANQVFDFMTHHRNFKQSAHLADGLYFEDWRNESKYINRIKSYVPWTTKFGTIKTKKPILILCPSGSSKDVNRQRYVTPEEYKLIINKNLDAGYEVYASGSISDFHYYGLINREDFHWLTSDKIYKWNHITENIDLRKMLQIINSANKVISVDTWIKTYALLCNIDTTIIKTRWNGQYNNYGDDVTDWIFLNKNIWPNLKVIPVEDLF